MPPEPLETRETLSNFPWEQTKDIEAKQINSKNHRKIQVIYAETAQFVTVAFALDGHGHWHAVIDKACLLWLPQT